MPTTKNRSEYSRRYYQEKIKPQRESTRNLGRCCYCGRHGPVTQEHIVPRARGGTDASDNLREACNWCNISRGARSMDEWRAHLGRKLLGVPAFAPPLRQWLLDVHGLDVYAVPPDVLKLVRFAFEGGDGSWRDALDVVGGKNAPRT